MFDRLALFALLLLCLIALPGAGGVAASELPVMAELQNGAPVRTDSLSPRPHVVVVWMESCAPCMEELRHLREIADRTPGWDFVTLALDAPETARGALPVEAAFAKAWVAEGKPGDVLVRLNPPLGALPMTIALSPRGRVCARRVGLLGSDIINGWTAQCLK
jgi:thiol-disulfide isomerase/thioredoxin